MISDPSGKVLFSVTSAPAPTKQFLVICAPFNTIAPIPIKTLSSIVQPCIIALCPIDTFLPILTG